MPQQIDLGQFIWPDVSQGRQPQGAVQINWANPITSGLTFAFIPALGVNLVTGAQVPVAYSPVGFAPGSGGIEQVNGEFGFNGAFYPGLSVTNGSMLTVCRAINGGQNNNYGMLVEDGSSGRQFGVGLWNGSYNGPVIVLDGAVNNYVDVGYNLWTAPSRAILGIKSTVNSTYSLWASGSLMGSGSFTPVGSGGYPQWYIYGNPYLGTALTAFWNRQLSAAEAASISANPWQIFATPTLGLYVPAGGISVAITGIASGSTAGNVVSRTDVFTVGDIQTTGWTTTASTYYGAINEVPYSDASYVGSPGLTSSPGSLIMTLSASLSTGNWQVAVRADYAGTSGQIRISLLDGSNTVVGVSGWQAVDVAFVEYDFTITTSATAYRVQIEVSP